MMNMQKIHRDPTKDDYNRLVDRINTNSHITGSDGVMISQGVSGTTISGAGVSGGGTSVILAKVQIDAPADTAISVKLLDTDNTTVTGSAFDVECTIIGGGNLNTALPLLETDDIILVNKINNEWWCLWWFNGYVECPT